MISRTSFVTTFLLLLTIAVVATTSTASVAATMSLWNTSLVSSTSSSLPDNGTVSFLGVSSDKTVVVTASAVSGNLTGIKVSDGSIAYSTQALAGSNISSSGASASSSSSSSGEAGGTTSGGVAVSSLVDFGVVAVDNGTKLAAFKATTGESLWTYSIPNSENVVSAPSIVDGVLSFRTQMRVYAGQVSASSGTPTTWTCQFVLNSTSVDMPPLIFTKDSTNYFIFVIDSQNEIYKIGVADGVAKWNAVHSTAIGSKTAFFSNDKIMFFATDLKLHAHSFDTGATIWKIATSATTMCRSPAFFNSDRNLAVFGCDEGYIVAMDNMGSAGALTAWKRQVSSQAAVKSGFAYSGSSTSSSLLYFGDSSSVGTIYSLDLSGGNPGSDAWSQTVMAGAPVTLVPVSVATSSAFVVVAGSSMEARAYSDPVVSTTTTTAASTTTTTVTTVSGQTPAPTTTTTSSTTATAATAVPTTVTDAPKSFPWIIQMMVTIPSPKSYFNSAQFISNLLSAASLSSSSTPTKLLRERPIGAKVDIRIGFITYESANAVRNLNDGQTSALQIYGKITFWSPSATTTGAPVSRQSVGGPLGAAIGTTVGIVVVFIVFLIYGFWKYTQEMTTNLADQSMTNASYSNFNLSTPNNNVVGGGSSSSAPTAASSSSIGGGGGGGGGVSSASLEPQPASQTHVSFQPALGGNDSLSFSPTNNNNNNNNNNDFSGLISDPNPSANSAYNRFEPDL